MQYNAPEGKKNFVSHGKFEDKGAKRTEILYCPLGLFFGSLMTYDHLHRVIVQCEDDWQLRQTSS